MQARDFISDTLCAGIKNRKWILARSTVISKMIFTDTGL
ncbi:hypothetical protein BRDCF_p97 [Bacteroidales bacterium CF]|nr:hypothetical protein BRDCF_p97 [Bacteroidales bacterium CF]